MITKRRAVVILSCLLLSAWSFQSVAEVTLSANDEGYLVWTGQGEELEGIEVTSPAGALVPVPAVGGTADASPFMFLLSNTPENVTWGNLGRTTTLDGDFVSQVGFVPGTDPELKSRWGQSGSPVPVTLDPQLLLCDDCPLPPLRVSLNDSNALQVTGFGQAIEQLNLKSELGALTPATGAAPFDSTPVNSANEIQFASGAAPVTIDGQVTLNAGWSEGGGRDVQFNYHEVGQAPSPFRDVTGYPQIVVPDPVVVPNPDPVDPPQQVPGDIRLSINEEAFLVFSGTGQLTRGLQVASPAGGLVPVPDSIGAEPFHFFLSNTSEQITWGNLGTDVAIAGDFVSAVRFRGDPELTAQWGDGNAPRDIIIDPEVLAFDCGNDCPPAPSGPVVNPVDPVDPAEPGIDGRPTPLPAEGRPPVMLSVDANNQLVVSADGVVVAGLDIISPSGSLIPPDVGDVCDVACQEAAAPFMFFLRRDANQVVYGNLGTGVTVDGSIVLSTGVDPNGPQDIDFSWGDGPFPIQGFVLYGEEAAAANPLPFLSVDADRGLVTHNVDEDLKTVTFTSASGVLESLDIPDTWTLVSSTDSEITFTSESGITAEEVANLELSWAQADDNAVFVNFTLEGGQSFGPFPLVGTENIPEPSAAMLLLFAVGLLHLRRGKIGS